MGDVRIIAVCTANICRSPSTAALLRRGLADLLPGAVVTSAGVAAQPDRPVCDLSAALVTGAIKDERAAARTAADLSRHRSALLTAGQVADADLVLGLDRSHRSAIAKLHPVGRPRTFTLRQAAAAAEQVGRSLRTGRLPEGAPALPPDAAGRLAWWVEELDAARAFIPGGSSKTAESLVFDQLDVPDPHVVGYQYHPMAAATIVAAVDDLLASLHALLGFGGNLDSSTLAERNGEAP
jgi:protein-tyrosine phosphatase